MIIGWIGQLAVLEKGFVKSRQCATGGHGCWEGISPLMDFLTATRRVIAGKMP